jgi:hypothetical protein
MRETFEARFARRFANTFAMGGGGGTNPAAAT